MSYIPDGSGLAQAQGHWTRHLPLLVGARAVGTSAPRVAAATSRSTSAPRPAPRPHPRLVYHHARAARDRGGGARAAALARLHLQHNTRVFNTNKRTYKGHGLSAI